MSRARMTHQKRERESQRRERAEVKAAKRAERRGSEDDRPLEEGEDPQIAGIKPGPQPPREDW